MIELRNDRLGKCTDRFRARKMDNNILRAGTSIECIIQTHLLGGITIDCGRTRDPGIAFIVGDGANRHRILKLDA